MLETDTELHRVLREAMPILEYNWAQGDAACISSCGHIIAMRNYLDTFHRLLEIPEDRDTAAS